MKNQKKTAAKANSQTSGAVVKNQKKTAAKGQSKAAGNAADPLSPADTLAQQLIAVLDQFKSLVPNYQPHDATSVHQVAAVARYADDLIPPIITTVTSYKPEVAGTLFNVEAGKAALVNRDAMRSVMQHLTDLQQGFQYTIDRQLADSVMEGLGTYSWIKSHAKSPAGAGARPYLAPLHRAVKKVNKGRGKKAAPKPTTPSPSVAPGANALLATNLTRKKDDGSDIAERFDRALEEAAKD